MAQESRTERLERMVRCKAHGLHYDPGLRSGCVLCQKEAAKSHARSGARAPILLLSLLGVVAVLFLIFGRDGDTPAGVSSEGAETGAATPADRLDPALYRRSIEALETVLFRTPVESGPDLEAARANLATAAGNLSRELRRTGPEVAAAEVAADEVAELGDAPEPFGFRELERARDDWLRIRQRHLRSAPWLAAPPAAGGAARDRPVRAEFRAHADALVALIQDGASRAATLAGEPPGPERDRGWREFLTDWNGRVEELVRSTPERPGVDAGADLLVAIQQLEGALQQTWTLSRDGSLPRGPDPAARFDEVLRVAERAREAFE
jgi:hypothetical protein